MRYVVASRLGRVCVAVCAMAIMPGCSWFSGPEPAADVAKEATAATTAEAGTVIEVTTQADFDNYIATKQFVVADFSATWCPPCKRMHPINEELAAAYPGVAFLNIDIDKGRELASAYGVRGVPTFLFFKDGAQVERNVGAMAKDAYEVKIKSHFGL